MAEGPDKLTDHDLLVRMDERTKKIDRCLSNHLSDHKRTEDHHRRMIVAAFGAALAALAAGVVSLIAWGFAR